MNSKEEAFFDFVKQNAGFNHGLDGDDDDDDDDESESDNISSSSSSGRNVDFSSDESSIDRTPWKRKRNFSEPLHKGRSSKLMSRYNEKELQLALMVIKKVMKMDEAQPFNAPFDPVAFGIPNHVNVNIDTPMDFGTIWNNLRNGVKYMNSEDVYMDVKCIWENCSKYSKKGDFTFYLMKCVKKNFLKYWAKAGLYSKPSQEVRRFSSRQSQGEQAHLPSSYGHRHQLQQPLHGTIWPKLSQLEPSMNSYPYQLEQPRPQSNYKSVQFSRLQIDTNGSSEATKSNYVSSCPENPMIDHASQPDPQQIHLRKDKPNCVQQLQQIQAEGDIGYVRDGEAACQGIVDLMTNSPNQEHEVQSNHSNSQPKLPSGSQNEPHQSHRSRQKKYVKSKAQDHNLCDSLDGKPIFIPINKLGQAVGPKATMLTNFLGKIGRDGHLAPLTYVSWRKMPNESKEEMWQLVQSKFDIDTKSKAWVLRTIGKRWKDWKAKLKADHYYPHKTDEERLNDCHPTVLPDQWQFLISYWNSDKVKLSCAKNKASRAKQKAVHTSGRKSFARLREEEKAKRPDGKEPTRSELYILTHTRKDGQPVDDAAAAIISKLREQETQKQTISGDGHDSQDTFFQVMGEEKCGRVRTYGLGPSPSALWGRKCVCRKMKTSATEEENRILERIEIMEQNYARMEAQINRMASTMQKYFTSIGASSDLGMEQTLDTSKVHEVPLQGRLDASSSNCADSTEEVQAERDDP